MSKNFQPLSSGEVLSVNSDSQIVIGHGTFRVGEFTTALKQLMLEHGIGGITPDNVDWLTADGVDCDVLRFGSEGWVKGKVRLHLEFSEEGDGEASPDPKTEAAIESITPVAAIAPLVSDVESPEALDLGDGFDGDLEAPVDNFPEPPIGVQEVFEKEAITSKDTFVQSEEESFDDLFGDEALAEEISDADDSFDDLFEAEDTPEVDVVPAIPEATEEDSFDDLFDDSDDLLAEAVTDEADQEFDDDLDLGLDDDLTDDDLGFDDEPTEVEAIATDDTPELDEDDLDDLFADSTDAALDLGDDDDDLDFDNLVETSTESPESGDESDDDLGLDDLTLDEDPEAEDDLLADPFDELGASDDADFSLDELTEEDGKTEAVLDDLSADNDDDFSFAELEKEVDFDLGDLDAGDIKASSEETPRAELDDDLGLGDDDDDFSFDDLDDGEASSAETPAAILEDDDLGLGDDDADFSFDDLDDGETPGAETPTATLEDDDLGLGSNDSDDFSFDDLAGGDDPDFDLGGGDLSLGEVSAETGESDLTGDDADFSFTNENEDTEGMEDLFGDLGDPTVGSLGDDVADTEASGDEDMSFENPFGESADDDDDDLTQDELPPEVDFGSTEDLGEFIDVSIFRKKPAPASTNSPFDELAGSELSIDGEDDDISLGDLFQENEAEGFNLDDLDSDPLDAVTGEEEEVSADIWDLE